MDINSINPKDYKYIVKKPVGFNPDRNKAVIQETIRETERYFAKLQDVFDDNLGERIEAVAAYGCYRFNRGDKTVDQYLGKKIMSQLIGEKILEKVRSMKAAEKLSGNTKFNKHFLL